LQQGDIVWCHNQPIFAAALEKEIHLKGAKLVYHCHDGLTGYPLRKAFKLFTPDAYVFVSEYLRQNFLHIFPWLRNTYTLHNGADEALFYPRQVRDGIDKTVPTILFVGRLHPVKGVHILLEAMSILQRRKVSAKCKVVGSSFSGGSKVTPYVKQLLKSSPSNVSFVGHRSALDIAEEYRSADILCCPSIWQEAFGMVNIEAMACGIPVVASRVGGIPEIAAGGGILLVEPDSPIELADALQKLIENRGLRAKVAADGLFSFQQQFAWTTINKQYESIVRRLI
jgi:spore coat protein SA